MAPILVEPYHEDVQMERTTRPSIAVMPRRNDRRSTAAQPSIAKVTVELGPVAPPPARLPEVSGQTGPRERKMHRFAVGERVQLFSGGFLTSRAYSGCLILRQLPYEGRELQYRVKSDLESWERIVTESHLAALEELS
jgi:hypothetical protein